MVVEKLAIPFVLFYHMRVKGVPKSAIADVRNLIPATTTPAKAKAK